MKLVSAEEQMLGFLKLVNKEIKTLQADNLFSEILIEKDDCFYRVSTTECFSEDNLQEVTLFSSPKASEVSIFLRGLLYVLEKLPKVL